MCRDFPYHKKADHISSKIWLIGRAYSASIERRKTEKKNEINDDYYSKKVVPLVRKSGLDSLIENCKHQPTLENIFIIHSSLMKTFNSISGQNKRSLASKYLHFHLPDLFFIFDSRAESSVQTLFSYYGLNPKNRKSSKDNRYDSKYVNFYFSCNLLIHIFQNEYGVALTPRKLDVVFLEIANNKNRLKLFSK